MGIFAFTVAASHSSLMAAALADAEQTTVLLDRLKTLNNLKRFTGGAAVWMAPLSLLIILLVIAMRKLSIRQQALWLGVGLTLAASALAVLPFWLQSGWPLVNFYLEWSFTAVRLVLLLLLNTLICFFLSRRKKYT